MTGFFLCSGCSIIVTDFIGYYNENITNDHMEAHFWNALFW